MKTTLGAALISATLLASGAALACDDMKMSGDYDGGTLSKAPETPVAAADKATPITSTKTKATTKQKTAGKPLAPGAATLTRTGG